VCSKKWGVRVSSPLYLKYKQPGKSNKVVDSISLQK